METEIIIYEFLTLEEFDKHFEIVTAVEGKESQLIEQSHRTVADTSEQIDEAVVKVVVRLKSGRRHTQQDAAAAAESFEISVKILWEYRVKDIPDLCLAAYP